MKAVLFITLIFIGLNSFSQIPKSGTYIFKYCDLEYDKCISTCKVIIKGDSITIYATDDLAKTTTGRVAGDIITKGIIFKHKSGKWIIAEKKEDKDADQIGVDGPPIIDFKKKQYWQF